MPATLTLDDLSIPAPAPGGADWNADGVVILRDLIPHDLMEAYEAEWMAANGWHGLRSAPDAGVDDALLIDAGEPGGWPDCTPYMRHEALRELCCYGPLADALEGLIGEPAGVHLNLTGWVSTQRNWHQDGYLNPDEVGDRYAAVWIALGDIHPDSGPFQYVPGSHRWHRLVRDRFAEVVDLTSAQWPKHTEDILTPLIDQEIADRDAEVVDHLPQAGDVLIWHPRLYHRGGAAALPGAYRPALIAHYSGIHHHSAMPTAVQHPAGGWYFPIEQSGPVR